MANVSLVQAVRVAARAAAIVTKQADQILPKNASQKIWFWYADPAEKRADDAEPVYTIKVTGKKGAYVATCDCPHRRKADLMATAEAEGKRVAPYQGLRCKHSTAVLHQLGQVDIVEYLKGVDKAMLNGKEVDLHAEAEVVYKIQAGIRVDADRATQAKKIVEKIGRDSAEAALRKMAVRVKGKGQNCVMDGEATRPFVCFQPREGEEPAAILARAQSTYPRERYTCSIVQMTPEDFKRIHPLS